MSEPTYNPGFRCYRKSFLPKTQHIQRVGKKQGSRGGGRGGGFPAPAAVPPIVSFCPSSSMPLPPSGTAAVPAMLVPIVFALNQEHADFVRVVDGTDVDAVVSIPGDQVAVAG